MHTTTEKSLPKLGRRSRLLALSRRLIDELSREDYEFSTVWEIILNIEDVLDSGERK